MSDLLALHDVRWPPAPTAAARHAVSSALDSRSWTARRYTRLAEQAMSDLTGAPHAVAFQSCTAAIHATLLAHGAQRGTPVHTPAFGFAGTLTGAAHIGATLLYHDVDLGTGNSVEPGHTPGQLVLTPDLHGVPHNLPRAEVITDACQSLGTLTDGRHGGATGTHCWSFSSTKLVAAPDGGAVTTDDEALAAELRQLRDYGAEPWESRANALITRPGHNWRPSELSMALVVEQLYTLTETAARAREVGARVQQTLVDCGLWHQRTRPMVEPAWHKLRTGLPGSGHRRLPAALTEAGMPLHRWGHHPLPDHPFFAPAEGRRHATPHAERLAAQTFCLGTEACPPWTWSPGETELVCTTLEMITEDL
ncbi:DegT/DnrJ/EryC1/StrS family aminotransferase [Streptomyces sp. NRRL B-1347]|uniref:DegT/DnrJ/EryC1/StrS family aminotransferase n=1 Tax=Streptomyces sp. NRRL B-1347 TaxID=1476877 RepID=UPI0004CAB8B1|nr:DegT/DnrJ/EryC1/StrS family aminotransferase [Streptomyces sp. NRRL B-1347]